MSERILQGKLVDRDDFTTESSVAIWLGNHTSGKQVDTYLRRRFSEDFCIRLNNDRMSPEVKVVASPQPLRELIHGFSRFRQFEDEFLDRASALGIAEASSALVFLFMAYSPEGLPVAKSPEMRFVGNCHFKGFE